MLTSYFIVIFLIFVCGWLLMLLLLAHLGGWAGIARKYPSGSSQYEGQVFRFSSLGFGLWCSYNCCVRTVVSDEGIAFSVLFPFRFCHAPIFIPWESVKTVSKRKVLFVNVAGIELSDCKTTLYVSRKLGTVVLAMAEAKGKAA